MTRRFRISVSVLFAVLAVLLCVFWVRSFWRNDRILIPIPGDHPLSVESVYGKIGFSIFFSKRPVLPNEFHWFVVVIDDDFGNGKPIETPRLEWYSLHGLTGLFVPYRLLVAVCGIFAIVTAYPFPDRYSLRTRLIARAIAALILVFVVWLAA